MDTNSMSSPVSRKVLYLLALGVASLAIGAFTLSFDALRSLASLAGIRDELSFLWPLVVDGFIVVATVSAVVMRDRGWRSAWYPWATLICFGTISVIGNALHAHAHASSTIGIGVAAMVSAVPAIALLLASHLFVLVMPRASGLEDSFTPDPSASGSETSSANPRVAESATSVSKELDSPKSETSPKRVLASDSSVQESDVIDRWISHMFATGQDLTGTMVSEKFGVSPATGRRRMAKIRDMQPALHVVRTGTSD